MKGVIEEMQDRIVSETEVLDNSWWTYRGISDHDGPDGLVHVIDASEENFKKVVYMTTGNLRIRYPKTHSSHREKYEIDQMALLEKGLEEISLYQFKLWISQGTFRPFTRNPD